MKPAPRRHGLAWFGLAWWVFAVSGWAVADNTQGQTRPPTPWGFNLSTYLWTPGLYGDFSSGQRTASVDVNFIDIFSKSSRVPLGFMGRLEAHYDRFALFVDGDYMNLQLKPVADRLGNGINSVTGIMDYGLMLRLFGAPASQARDLAGSKRPNILDVYAGARTLWLDNSVTFYGPFGFIERSPSASKALTSPLVGARFIVDFTPHWFLLADANIGGFGASHVQFTGGITGMAGYRTTVFDYPTSFELGYKAIRYQVDKDGPAAVSATRNGPFVGMTGHW